MTSLNSPTMNSAIVTPSYAPDFERCELLCRSIDQFVLTSVKHYIVVDQRDLSIFRQLENSRTTLLTVESIMPWWIRREPIFRKVWLSLKSLPIRNWLLQQIVKLSVAQQIQEEISIFVDSDVVFVRSFDPRSMVRGDQVRLYRDPIGNEVQRNFHLKWHQSAAKLLGLDDIDPTVPDYIGNLISWRRDRVQQLCQHLEKISGKGWIETLAGTWHLSEYVLYGMFVDRVLQDQSGHYPEPQSICHDYWFPKPLSQDELKAFIQKTAPDQVAIMISAKAEIPIQHYEPLLQPAFLSETH